MGDPRETAPENLADTLFYVQVDTTLKVENLRMKSICSAFRSNAQPDSSGWQIGFTEGTQAPGETPLFDTSRGSPRLVGRDLRLSDTQIRHFDAHGRIIGESTISENTGADGHVMLIAFAVANSPAVSHVASNPGISGDDDSGRDCRYMPSWSLNAICRSRSLSELNKHLINLINMRFSHDFGPHWEDVYWQSSP
jgi:hypothetical protein